MYPICGRTSIEPLMNVTQRQAVVYGYDETSHGPEARTYRVTKDTSLWDSPIPRRSPNLR